MNLKRTVVLLPVVVENVFGDTWLAGSAASIENVIALGAADVGDTVGLAALSVVVGKLEATALDVGVGVALEGGVIAFDPWPH